MQARSAVIRETIPGFRCRSIRATYLQRNYTRLPYRILWDTIMSVIEIRKTQAFADWFSDLRDKHAKARIQVRIDRMSLGNLGDTAPVGEGVSELRIHYGPGYRVYFIQRGHELIILLGGGDKGTQRHDIKAALALAREL
jgi:putative addiction module killer protein